MANKALVPVKFEIPEELLEILQAAHDKYAGKTHGAKSVASEGLKRCERLLREKALTYYQIKRMIHDVENINRYKDPVAYELNGGQKMYLWATKVLDEARREVESRKNSQKQANDIGGLGGIRKNAYIATHEKNGDSLDSILFGSSETKSTITPMISEEIERIKSLINKLKN